MVVLASVLVDRHPSSSIPRRRPLAHSGRECQTGPGLRSARRANRHRHRLLLPVARRHHRARRRPGPRARKPRPRGHGGHRAPGAHAPGVRRRRARPRAELRDRAHGHRHPAVRAVLGQQRPDAAHDTAPGSAAAARALSASAASTSCTCTPRTTRRSRPGRSPSARTTRSAWRPFTACSRRRPGWTSWPSGRGRGSSASTAASACQRGLHRLARPVLPVRLRRDPERHRRRPLLARRRARRRAQGRPPERSSSAAGSTLETASTR